MTPGISFVDLNGRVHALLFHLRNWRILCVMADVQINKTTTVIYTASLVQFQISALTKPVAVAESIDKASCLVVWINEVWLNF